MKHRTGIYDRRTVLRSLLGLGAIGLGLQCRPALAQAETVFRRGDPTLPLVAATYDDCYAVDILRDLEALLTQSPATHVTFFPVGTALLNTTREDEDIWKRLRDAGHEVGYHTHEHRRSSELTVEEMREDYARWLEAATTAWGEEPEVRFARPPYADLSDSFRELCREQELAVAWWTHDWSYSTGLGPDPGGALQGGDIGLLHPGTAALEMTADVLAWLPRLGLRGVGLSRLYDAWLEPDAYAEKELFLPVAYLPTPSGEPEIEETATFAGAARLKAAEVPASSVGDVRAVAVHVVPVRPRGDAWSCDVQVKVANVGAGLVQGAWAQVRLLPESKEGECAAELRWRLPDMVPGNSATLTARQAVSGPAAVLLPVGRYTAALQVGLGNDAEADGNPDNNAIGPYPFELLSPSRTTTG